MYHMSFQPHNHYGLFLVLSDHYTDGQTEALRGHTVLVQQDLRACAHILNKWSCLIKGRVETEGPCSYQSISRSLKGTFGKKQKKSLENWKKATDRWKLVRSSWFEAVGSTSWIYGGHEKSTDGGPGLNWATKCLVTLVFPFVKCLNGL